MLRYVDCLNSTYQDGFDFTTPPCKQLIVSTAAHQETSSCFINSSGLCNESHFLSCAVCSGQLMLLRLQVIQFMNTIAIYFILSTCLHGIETSILKGFIHSLSCFMCLTPPHTLVCSLENFQAGIRSCSLEYFHGN